APAKPPTRPATPGNRLRGSAVPGGRPTRLDGAISCSRSPAEVHLGTPGRGQELARNRAAHREHGTRGSGGQCELRPFPAGPARRPWLIAFPGRRHPSRQARRRTRRGVHHHLGSLKVRYVSSVRSTATIASEREGAVKVPTCAPRRTA